MGSHKKVASRNEMENENIASNFILMPFLALNEDDCACEECSASDNVRTKSNTRNRSRGFKKISHRKRKRCPGGNVQTPSKLENKYPFIELEIFTSHNLTEKTERDIIKEVEKRIGSKVSKYKATEIKEELDDQDEDEESCIATDEVTENSNHKISSRKSVPKIYNSG